MNTTLQTASLVAALALGFTLGGHQTDGSTDTSEPAQDQKPSPTEPALTDDMLAWIQAGTPGEMHRLMDPLIGTWDAQVTLFMDPTDPAVVEVSNGTMVNEWILDGRYVRGDFDGMAMGQPFQGMSLFAYDNAMQTYRGLWIDSMSTGLQESAGYADEAGNAWTMITTTTDPATGGPMNGKERIVFESDDRLVMTAWYELEGAMVKSMEIAYTRRQ